MMPSYNLFLHVTFVFFVGVSFIEANPNGGTLRLEDVIEEAERESKILVNEINQWLVQESASFLEADEKMHLRSRRSIDADHEDVRTDANLLSEVGQLIVRRDLGEKSKKDKKSYQKKNGMPVVKSKNKKINGYPVKKHIDHNAKRKDSLRLLKKQRLSIQADKHHAKADKDMASNDDLSKENLVKELIGAEAKAKTNLGVPEKAYRELVEFIASSEQPTIETSSKKSDIARPSATAQVRHKKLTKKHKRILTILAKMAPNALRKYFHRKGLDRYWNVMDNIKKTTAAKQSEKKKLKAHKVAKVVKQDEVVSTPEKAKSFSGIRHLEKDASLKNQSKSRKKKSKKAASHHKVVKDKVTSKTHKHNDLQSTSTEKVVSVKPEEEEEKHSKTLTKAVKDRPVHRAENENQKITEEHAQHPKKISQTVHHEELNSQKVSVERSPKEIPQAHKDQIKNMFKAIKSKDVVKEEKNDSKVNAGKSPQVTKTVASHEKDSLATKNLQKLKDVSKQETGGKDLKSVGVNKASWLSKKVTDKVNDPNVTAQDNKIVKVTSSHLNTVTSLNQPTKMIKQPQAIPNNDLKTEISPSKHQEQQVTPQHQLNPKAVSTQDKVTDKVSSKDNEKLPKEIIKVHAVTAHHVIKTTHAQQPEVKQDEKSGDSSQAAHENLGSAKIADLKEKIRKTNSLKLKVAQALLAHCETQNRLRKVFDDVNSSLKKAAVLAKAIGAKFGIKQSDIDKMTSEHTKGAVEEFLNQLF